MPKKRRVPEVLWRLFRHRARTLASTIVSLVPPPPPSSCSCSRTGSQCLSCSGSEAMSFLVRNGDPQEYVKLLNKCFVVVSENAPPLSPFQSPSRWPQSQIVQRTIEFMMHEQFNSINVICKAYDKINRASPIVELLSSSAWCLLSQRVGDDVMVYLLKYTSIFLPVSSKKHHQVTGPPISDLCLEQSKKRTLESQYQHTSLDKCGSKKKRALVDNFNPVLEIQKCSNFSSVDDPSTSLDYVGSNVRSSSSPRTFSRLHGNKCSQASSSEVAIPISGTVTNNTEGDLNEKLQESSNHTAAKFGKRSRPFSWQRRRNRRRLNFEETSPFTTIYMDKDGVSGRLQHDADSSLNSSEKMPCFSVSQAPKPLVVAKRAHINRKFMFYNRECSSSVFPAKHILNSLKPNFSGANFLIGDIFGLNATQEMLCKSACLYRSLVKLLKKLIRKAQHCQRLRLLDKHCAVPTLDATVKSGTNFEDWSRHVKKEELFFNLKEHVKYNVLQLDKKFFVLGVGIPQGSIVSPLLCSFYYGHLERNLIIPYLEKASEAAAKDISRRPISNNVSAEESSGDGYILLRFIDDFLLVSTSKKLAASFVSRLRRGFHVYNCYMNDEKFSINFDIGDLSGIPSSRVYVGEDGISFLRWSGLLINCFTLEVQADYSKYLNNHLSSTLTVSWQGKPGHHLKTKLCGFMRPKCHPIFFCSNINSADVVRLNIYQAFLVCAMKFHCYVRDLSYICKLRKGFYLKMIQKSVRYMHKLIKKRMRSAYCYSDIRPILQLEEEEVGWLGLYAYIQVLKRKESRHKQLLSSLRCELAHKIHTSEPLPSQLKYAVDASHSSLIWKIKY